MKYSHLNFCMNLNRTLLGLFTRSHEVYFTIVWNFDTIPKFGNFGVLKTLKCEMAN